MISGNRVQIEQPIEVEEALQLAGGFSKL